MFNRLIDSVLEDFGRPVSLQRALAAHPQLRVDLDEPAHCIHAGSVTRWNELGTHSPLQWPHRQRGFLRGWHASGGAWRSFHIVRPEYAFIGECDVEEQWQCELTDLDGFSCSKSDLQAFPSIDAMAEERCEWLISEISPESLARSLAHTEIRIIHDPKTSDHFSRFLWDGRLWLMNDGGSHHTAAARYLSSRLNRPVSLVGNLHRYSISAAAVVALRRDFEMFVVSHRPFDGSIEFEDAMCAVRATWLWHSMPEPWGHARAILLPRTEGRSMRVAETLRAAGFLDLGEHLSALCLRQEQLSRSMGSEQEIPHQLNEPRSLAHQIFLPAHVQLQQSTEISDASASEHVGYLHGTPFAARQKNRSAIEVG